MLPRFSRLLFIFLSGFLLVLFASLSNHTQVLVTKPPSPFDDIAVHIPPFVRNGEELVPGFKFVMTDLYGDCSFGNYCKAFSTGSEYKGHEHVVEAILFALKVKCSSEQSLAIDLGANIGFFTAIIASLGCNVISLEPQTPLVRFLRATIEVNGWHKMVSLQNAAAGAEVGTLRLHKLWVLGGAHKQRWNRTMIAPVIPMRHLVHRDIAFLKIDVDGPDALLLRALLPLLETHNVWNVIVELNMRSWPTASNISVEEGVQLVSEFYRLGYSLYLVCRQEFPSYHVDVLQQLGEVRNWNHFTHAYHIPKAQLRNVLAMNDWYTKNIFFSKDTRMRYNRYHS